jgi:hypothetical protein
MRPRLFLRNADPALGAPVLMFTVDLTLEAGVRRQTVVVELLVPPTDGRFSFAIRSASCGNLPENEIEHGLRLSRRRRL